VPFPNKPTQFRPGIGGDRLGKPRPLVGKRRARKLQVAAARIEAVRGRESAFEGDSLGYLRAIMRGEIEHDAARMAAAMALAQYEHPRLNAVAAMVEDPEETRRAEWLRTATPGERLLRLQALSTSLGLTLTGKFHDVEPSPAPLTIAHETPVPATQAEPAVTVPAAPTQNDVLKAQITELERLNSGIDNAEQRNRLARLRQALGS
jgi:hypothetical protein